MNIYRNITYILYLFLFVPVFEGSAMMYVAKGSALSEDATHKLLAGTFDVGSLTCILIGRPLELRPSGITPDDLKLGGEKADRAVGGWGGGTSTRNGALCRGPTQSENRQIYFDFKVKKEHRKQCT